MEEVAGEGDGVHYAVPRVRVMFAAEDPEVFGRRIAYAYRARYVIHGTRNGWIDGAHMNGYMLMCTRVSLQAINLQPS